MPKIDWKVIIAIAVSLIVGLIFVIGGIFLIQKQNDISNRQTEIEKSVVAQKELADHITRSMAEYATRQDIENLAKSSNLNLQAIQDDLKKLNASVDGISKVTVSTTGYTGNNISSTHTDPGGTTGSTTPPPPTVENINGKQVEVYRDDFGYMKNVQELKIDEPFGKVPVPFGEARFSAWQSNPWGLTVFPRNYKIVTVLGKDPEGRDYVYNKFSIESQGKSYDVDISHGEFLQQYPDPSFSWWNPRLFIGMDIGATVPTPHAEFVPGLHVAVMSYGKTKIEPTWSFAELGVGYGTQEKDIKFTLTPAAYNIGEKLPLMKNLFIGPTIGVGTSGTFFVGAGIRVGL